MAINKKKVYRLCKELGVLKPQRRLVPKYPRKLACNRQIDGPNQLWETDIKYGYIAGEERFFFIQEIYVGLDRKGVHYVFPVQAKGGSDILSVVQIEQDYAMCTAKFKKMICRPIGAQFISDDLISLFEFVQQDGKIRTAAERHYRLVPAEDVTAADLENYKKNSI